MKDELKGEIIRTALNAIINSEVTTKFFEENYIIRIQMFGKKDYIDCLPMQTLRLTKTHILVDNIVKRFRHYLYTEYINSQNMKIVFDYLTNKEFQKTE